MHVATHASVLSPWIAVVDPVCGAQVGPVPIAYHAAYGDEDYFFCSVQCAERFKADPTGVLQRRAARNGMGFVGGPAAAG